MSNILVTGATGFIGRYLLPVLHQQGWQIRATVRNNFIEDLPFEIENIKVGEIDGNTDWSEAVRGMDAVIHLAARAHVLKEEIDNPEAEFLRVNTEGTANLVKQSIAAGVKHFIFISSIGAMATLSECVLTEKSPCQPDTPYGRSKLQAERALINLAKESEMTWTILRPTLVYGAGNPGNMERLMKLIEKNLPLPFASVKNRRSFIFVGNLVDAIATCFTHPNAANQIFLVNDDRDLSTPELICQIAKEMNRPCNLFPVPPNLLKFLGYSGDTLQKLTKKSLPFNSATIDRLLGSLFVDISHIKGTLNWQPPFTIERGIEQTLQTLKTRSNYRSRLG